MKFSKLKVRTRVQLGLFCVFVTAMIVVIYAIFSLLRVTSYISRIETLTNVNNQVNYMVQAHYRWISRITESFMFDTSFEAGHPATCIWGNWRYSDQIYDIDDSEIMRLIHAVDHPHARLHLEGAEALRLRDEGYHEEALLHLQKIVLPYGFESTRRITDLSNRYQYLWHEAREDLRDVGPQVIMVVSFICAFALLAFVFFSIIIPRSVIKPLKQLNELMKEVTKGNFNVNFDSDVANDEIGEMTASVCEFIGTVKDIVDDIPKLYEEHNDKGNYEYRMDEARYSGDYKLIAQELNKLVNMYAGNYVELLQVVVKYGDGDFAANVSQYPDSWKWAQDGIEALRENFINIIHEMKNLVLSVSIGKLSARADSDKFNGSWSELINELNNLTTVVEKPVSEIRDVVARFNAGYFDKFLVGDYSGDFLLIKEDMNQLVKDVGEYVHEISDALGSIADGDLTRRSIMKFDGDFNIIGKSINIIAETLQKTMTEISVASEQVLSGANQISTTATHLANGASEQASSVEELNASIELINQKTTRNADNAEEASNLSNQSSQHAGEGNEAMQKMLEAMQGIKVSSGNISKIIKTIQDIAFQTNLLALNAAVEAARAGEHGRGFAVVAEEVRNLAVLSQEAATETTGLIEDSIIRVDTGSGIAGKTADALNNIVASADEVLQIINGISVSSKEQAEALGQVIIGLGQISSVVQSNSAVSEETAAAAEELNSQAELLRELVSYFRLG